MIKQNNSIRQGEAHGNESSASRADGVTSSASEMAANATSKAKDMAANAAGTVSDQVTQLLDRQVGAGAKMMTHAARSAKRAAEELNQEAPQLANLVRTVAGQIDGYADNLRDQSVHDLIRSASDFTRRQPALVFTAAAFAGFFALRMIKSSTSISAPSIQPPEQNSEPTRSSNGVRSY